MWVPGAGGGKGRGREAGAGSSSGSSRGVGARGGGQEARNVVEPPTRPCPDLRNPGRDPRNSCAPSRWHTLILLPVLSIDPVPDPAQGRGTRRSASPDPPLGALGSKKPAAPGALRAPSLPRASRKTASGLALKLELQRAPPCLERNQTFWLCDLRQVHRPLCAVAPSSVWWELECRPLCEFPRALP